MHILMPDQKTCTVSMSLQRRWSLLQTARHSASARIPHKNMWRAYRCHVRCPEAGILTTLPDRWVGTSRNCHANPQPYVITPPIEAQ